MYDLEIGYRFIYRDTGHLGIWDFITIFPFTHPRLKQYLDDDADMDDWKVDDAAK